MTNTPRRKRRGSHYQGSEGRVAKCRAGDWQAVYDPSCYRNVVYGGVNGRPGPKVAGLLYGDGLATAATSRRGPMAIAQLSARLEIGSHAVHEVTGRLIQMLARLDLIPELQVRIRF